MAFRRNPITRSGDPGRQKFRLLAAAVRVRPVILLIGAAIIGWGIYSHWKQRTEAVDAASDIRMPITNAPLEPDRPDLIGEPRIDE